MPTDLVAQLPLGKITALGMVILSLVGIMAVLMWKQLGIIEMALKLLAGRASNERRKEK